MRQTEPVPHVGKGGERRDLDVTRGQRCLDLTKRDPGLAGHNGAQDVRVRLQQRTAVATDLGSVLPVSGTRRISLMAADALTSKRLAACRIELPASTARAIRCRRS